VCNDVKAHVGDAQMDAAIRGGKHLHQAERVGGTARTGDTDEERSWLRDHLGECSTQVIDAKRTPPKSPQAASSTPPAMAIALSEAR